MVRKNIQIHKDEIFKFIKDGKTLKEIAVTLDFPKERVWRWVHRWGLIAARACNRYTAFGERKSLNEWAQDDRCRVPLRVLKFRISYHKWSIEKSLTTPKGKRTTPELTQKYGKLKS